MNHPVYWIALQTALGVHSKKLPVLLEYFEDAEGVFEAAPEELKLCPTLTKKEVSALIDYHTSISLKLAQRELMGREAGEEPVLLLDDVLSELDPGRQDFVLNQIVSGQVFITCCEPGRFTKLGKTIEIERGQVIG